MTKEIIYSVVVPLYKEKLVVSESYRRLKFAMDKTEECCEVIFINDVSKDNTRRSLDESKNRHIYMVQSAMKYNVSNKIN